MDRQTSLSIPIVLGSVRRNRRSHDAARLLVDRVSALGHQPVLVDLRELNLPIYDEEESSEGHQSVRAFRGLMATCDASVWLSPEYNHGYTSVIKNAVDYLRPEIRRKPVAVCGLSSGVMGGVRAVEQLKQVFIELHAVPIRASVYFNDARSLFGPDGSLTRPEIVDRIDDVVADLVWYARSLKWGRENLPMPERKR